MHISRLIFSSQLRRAPKLLELNSSSSSTLMRNIRKLLQGPRALASPALFSHFGVDSHLTLACHQASWFPRLASNLDSRREAKQWQRKVPEMVGWPMGFRFLRPRRHAWLGQNGLLLRRSR